MRIEIQGEPGRDYSIEATDALGAGGWEPIFNFTLLGDTQRLLDPASTDLPRRFYRAVTFDRPALPEYAWNFRLIDHQGKSRELNYHWTDTNVSAFVLLFTVNGCAAVRDLLPALDTLRSQYEPRRVRFWMINSDPSDRRSNIVAEAAALGLTLPVLHDRAQLVARSYGVATATEAFVVARGDFPNEWNIRYRGALDDRAATDASPAQRYVADALEAALAGGSTAFKRAPITGCSEALHPAPAVTYAADIAPILQARCVRCHSPGNIAPWSMTNHAIVQENRWGIRASILEGHMPPWHADPEYGSFTNDFSLKPDEARKLMQWIDEGAPSGDGPDPLASSIPPTEYPFAWPSELGEPDAVLTYPDGRRETLLSVPHFHPHWLTIYPPTVPKRLPAGTTIQVTGVFDNSPQNDDNPAPSQIVNWGPQLTDDMFLSGITYAEALTIRTQPQNHNALRGANASFTVGATSPNGPLRYQWRFNGAVLSGVTNASFTVTNAQTVHEGLYTVTVTDSAETLVSQPAQMAVGNPPVITQPPVAQTVRVGGTATFSVSVSGTPPFGYQWRKGSTPLTNIVQNDATSTFTIFNVRTNDAGNYRVIVTNAFNMTPGAASTLAPLTVTTP